MKNRQATDLQEAAQPSTEPRLPSAPINRVIPFSTVDGPGNRTAVFFQGCNLACRYCHNPETLTVCRHCGICVGHCPVGALEWDAETGKRVEWDESLCIQCDRCIQTCPYFSSPRIHWLTVEQVMDRVRPNMPFIRGITVSGGESTLYPAFLTKLFAVAHREGLSTIIDSNGTADFFALSSLLEVTDGVMFDVKAWDPAVYHALTAPPDIGWKDDKGTSAKEAALENIRTRRNNMRLLAGIGKLTELRIVCLEGHVDAEAAISGCAAILGTFTASTRLKLIAFRNNGVRGSLADAHSPAAATMTNLRDHARRAGFLDVVVT